jgi:hypothetical protein
MQDSLARTLASLESRQVLAKEPGQGFTGKSCELLAVLDQDTSSWKMWPLLSAKALKKYSKTWPKWGMTQDGSAFVHPMSERRITETDGLHWPTLRTTGITGGSGSREMMQSKVMNGDLSETEAIGMLRVKLWPTPNASDNRDRGNMSNPSVQRRIQIGKQIGLSTAVKETSDGGTLNPTWVEWLMGFPTGFTVSKDWVTPKSRSKPQQHLKSSSLPEWLK